MNVCLYNPIPEKAFAPLNLAYLASYLEAAFPGQHTIRIIDSCFSRNPVREIVAFAPEVVGFTTLSASINKIYRECRQVKAALSDAMLVCGGIHATIRPDEVLTNGFDVAVIGEGERTFAELIQKREARGKPLSCEDYLSIAGTACHDNTRKVRRAPPRDLIMNLDALPRPARHLLNWRGYASRFSVARGMNTDHVYTMHGSRGCPFRCIFCGVNFSFAGTVRRHSPQYIAEEMVELVEKFGARWIYFTDDTCFVDKRHMESLCREIIERGLHRRVKWEVQIRSNLIREKDQELLRLMRGAGCRQVDIGFETANPRMLTVIKGKGITVEDHQRAIDMLHAAGIGVLGTFILAAPTETYDEMMDTVRFIRRNYRKLACFQCGPLVPFPGTPAYEMAVKDGIIADDYVRFLDENGGPSVICSRNVTRQQVDEACRIVTALAIKKISIWHKLQWLGHNLWHHPDVIADGIKVGIANLHRRQTNY